MIPLFKRSRAAKQLNDEYKTFKAIGLTRLSWYEYPLQYLAMRLHYPPIGLAGIDHAVSYYRVWCADEHARLKFVFVTHTVTELTHPELGSKLVSNIAWHYSHTPHAIDANHRWVDCAMLQKEKPTSAMKRAVNIRPEYVDQMYKDEPHRKDWGFFRTVAWLWKRCKSS